MVVRASTSASSCSRSAKQELRRCRTARRPRAVACLWRTAARISLSVPTFSSASASTSSARACGTTTTPSSSPTTQSPGSNEYAADRNGHLRRLELPAPGRVLGRDVRAEDRKPELPDEAHVAAAPVEHAAGDVTGGERRHGELAEMSGDIADRRRRRLHGRRAPRPSIPRTLRSASSYDEVSAGLPLTVNAGPASVIPRSSARIEGGSVCSRYPRASRMSASAAV